MPLFLQLVFLFFSIFHVYGFPADTFADWLILDIPPAFSTVCTRNIADRTCPKRDTIHVLVHIFLKNAATIFLLIKNKGMDQHCNILLEIAVAVIPKGNGH